MRCTDIYVGEAYMGTTARKEIAFTLAFDLLRGELKIQ